MSRQKLRKLKPAKAISKQQTAEKSLKAVKEGEKPKALKKTKVSYRLKFRRPKTLETPKSPKYERKAVPASNKFKSYEIIKSPLATESAMKEMDQNNTLTFIVSNRAHKPEIKKALKELYDIETIKINTLIRCDGSKKAFIKLSKDQSAQDIASKIGLL